MNGWTIEEISLIRSTKKMYLDEVIDELKGMSETTTDTDLKELLEYTVFKLGNCTLNEFKRILEYPLEVEDGV